MQVNEETRQKEMTSSMHFKIDEVISFVSRHMTLTEGDLILTGTPAGVGPLKQGDKVLATAKVQGKIVGKFSFNITK
jgi:2-keto-4-pentenoate hydratase/2-oxohepta-3-ene-1,7-dioic acid hydratase in catechol pathway